MNYIGEHVLPGQIGHFFAVLFLMASLVATVAYIQSFRLQSVTEKQSWLYLVRCITLFPITSSNTNMPIRTAIRAYRFNTCWPVSGKARKEVLCSGVSGIVCWDGFWFGVPKNGSRV